MRIGLALPHYDYSVPGESPLTFPTVAQHARRAEAAGYDSLWVSDHLFLDIAKYGGSDDIYGALEPIATLGALAGVVARPRLGTLVLCEALRPPSVAAKALATLDRITGGRLDVGLGAGWYEPEYAAIGMAMPSPGVRLRRLREATEIVTGLLGGEPLTFSGEFFHTDGARVDPPALQEPRPPVFLGGKGDRLLATVAACADGWNTCWVWTHDDYRARLAVLDRACEQIGRDPSTVWRSLGLYSLVGEDEADLERRFERLRAATPAGVLDTVSLADWRVGRLVGTVEQVREQAAGWGELGVETIIVGAGALPFHVASLDDVDALAEALGAGTAG
ncbi:MAG: LLM class flavin-dependent oxidoreductase [Acidimicrobiia bacterium]|jgi:alkanesulfonate monooxygenase SsuD/methylene tetrahydromethanopterin reductase-like flavin-dependent oxidoreductase (luciferase family)